MKILITGASGYIGSVLVPYLLNKGHEITAIDNLFYNQNSLLGVCNFDKFNFVNADTNNPDILKKYLKNQDIIIPLACLVGAPLCDKYPELAQQTNFNSIKLLNSIRSKQQYVIYPTTNSGYGIGEKDKYCTEETPLKPISLYGKTKVESERLLLESENVTTLRLATVFGVSPRMRTDLLVNNFVLKAIKDKVLVLFEKDFTRNYIHIDDVAMTFDFCINNHKKVNNDKFNVGLTSANLTKLQLAEKIKKHIPNLEIILSEFNKDPDKRDYLISNEKLEKIGWLPNKTLDNGITELIKCYNLIDINNYTNI